LTDMQHSYSNRIAARGYPQGRMTIRLN